MAFDIIGAKQAGFTDPEIAQEMAGKYGFNYQGARKAGFTDQQIIGEMLSKSDAGTTKVAASQSKQPSPAEVERMRNQFVNQEGTIGTKARYMLSQAFDPSQSIAPADSLKDWAGRVVPRSITQLAPKVVQGAGDALSGIGKATIEGGANPFAGGGALANTIKGAGAAALSGVGFGQDQNGDVNWSVDNAKNAWLTDPAMAVAGLAPMVKPAVEVVKPVVETGKAAASTVGDVASSAANKLSPESLYASSLKMSTGKNLSVPERAARAKTGLEGGYIPTEKGYGKLMDDIGDINNQISYKIQEAKAGGKMVSVDDIVKPLNEIRERAQYDINPQPLLEKINEIEDNLRSHPLAVNAAAPKMSFADFSKGKMGAYMDSEGGHGPAMQRLSKEYADYKSEPSPTGQMIPVDVAQKMKIETYRGLKNAYGEMKSGEVEARKAVARGLKEQIVQAVPEIAELNAKDSALINLEKSLGQATKRIANRDVSGIGGPLKMAGGGMVDLVGGHGLGITAGALLWALDNPTVKANLAIALFKVRKAAGKTVSMPKIKAEIEGLKTKLPVAQDNKR